ncbi:phosphate butyryltransferase [Thermotoga sp. Ku-13t]|uniref:bifunctional enoyl-CoA hydratase/phosphate acetyltransferase n=1 Tax=Thermotoga sp. Ku-13t TaxID=1755813 RepID=UPI0013EAC4AE|nr:bifunctional enoyl-CoA hydratase/phosphate acetyltransferase [Thermotoga sp. Ku-13t]KAF2958949.1 phosphate butyryltransferase [Thermotoga sp. Ku-13t]
MDRLAFLVERARGLRKKIVVAGSNDDVVLSALKMALEHSIVEPVLVGPEVETKALAERVGLDLSRCELIDCQKDQSARVAVEVVSERGELLMKGSVKTGDLMKVVLEDQYNLKTGSTITMVSVFDVPTYHKLLAISDAGMIIAPTLEQKIDMINVSVKVVKKLGIEKPKVAIVGAIEVPNVKMPATLDAAVLSKMSDRGQIKDCIVDGPFALDNAISKEAAEHKKIESPVAGDADILIMPDIEAGNVLYKALVFFANATVASVILGARIPIVLTSRADSDRTKLYSIALAAILC